MMSKSYEQYEHHGVIVWVDSELKGNHRDRNLCFSCNKFTSHGGCTKATELYKFCVENNMTTPVAECPDFSETK